VNDTTSGIHPRPQPSRALTVDRLVSAAEEMGGVRRRDLIPGDRIIVSTRNSVYSLTARSNGSFLVSGGWYERQGLRAIEVDILGCTAGGHALFTEHIAAPGLFLEFGDGTRTTRIRTVRRIAGGRQDN
jgi:hypothetical protein